jgi:sugar O-acyltransferase (sialic acid O-acetyltransferase NeuD family)
MRDLFIVGDGVHGREMADIVERINRVAPMWNLLGFLSSRTAEVGSLRNGYPVIGLWQKYQEYPNAALIADNEWPASLPLPRNRMISLIDPSTFVSHGAQIGIGCVFYPNCFIGYNACVGDHVFSLTGCTINHDDVIEDRVVFASGVTLAGSVHVETGCYLGQSCSVRQLLRIGKGSMIGMGAVVIRDVPPDSVVVGNPGRLLPKHSPST